MNDEMHFTVDVQLNDDQKQEFKNMADSERFNMFKVFLNGDYIGGRPNDRG